MELLNQKDVCKKLGLSRSKLWEIRKDGLFPQPINVAGRRVAFLASEVEDWIQTRIDERDRRAA